MRNRFFHGLVQCGLPLYIVEVWLHTIVNRIVRRPAVTGVDCVDLAGDHGIVLGRWAGPWIDGGIARAMISDGHLSGEVADLLTMISFLRITMVTIRLAA